MRARSDRDLRRERDRLLERARTLERKVRELEEELRLRRLATHLAFDRVYRFEVTEDGDLRMAEEVVGRTREVTGLSKSEWKLSGDWKKIVSPDCWTRVEREIEKLIAGRPCTIEVCLRRGDGTRTWHVLHGFPDERDPRGRTKSGTFLVRDITDKKLREQELLKLERMRTVRELAAGVAHNLNDMLTTIIGPARDLADKLRDPELAAQARILSHSAKAISDLVRKLGSLAGDGLSEETETVSLNEAVKRAAEGVLDSVYRRAGERNVEVEIEESFGEDAKVRASSGILSEILLNLMLNAVDALRGRGTIVIRTRSAGGRACIEVQDDGVGMSEEVRRRVFEPFFTTKSELGTGLGLASVHSAVSSLGGGVEVESEPGRGSVFRVWLPAAVPARASARDVPTCVRERARVLLVEDSPSVALYLQRVLADEHDVQCCRSAADALRAFRPGSFEVAIIDLGMPGMPGDELARRLKAEDRDLVTVMISGWDLGADDPRLAAFDFSLRKPLADRRELAQTVARAIALRRGPRRAG